MIPNLLHPVPVDVEQLDKSGTIYDDDFREPTQQVEHKTVVHLEGQVHWGEMKEVGVTQAGVEENAAGYVVFRYVDLEAQSVVLRLNDRITRLGKLDTDLYITKLKPSGHWPDQGGATLLKAYFMDRQPSRQEA